MEVREIEQYLEELGAELTRRKFREPVRVLMIGGAFMVSQFQNRLSTQDIDIVLLNLPATTDEPVDARSRAFRAAVWAVAKNHKIPRHWANDDSTFFIRELTPTLPQGLPWHSYGMLEVFIPPKEYILALKLMTFRAKDYADVEVLLEKAEITTRDEARALLKRYTDTENPRLWVDYEVEKTLRILFDSQASFEREAMSGSLNDP